MITSVISKPSIQICGRLVGEDYPPLIIAEIGINHEGSLQTAYEFVDAAISSGAEMIKHQTHVVEDEMIPAAKEVIPGNSDVSIYEIMERCALSEKDFPRHIDKFINQNSSDGMDVVLGKTILGFSDYVNENSPDLIILF